MKVELIGRLHSEPRVREAWHHSHASTGLFIRGLTWMAEHGWDPSVGSSRFLPGDYVFIWLSEGTRRFSRRPINALVRAELWVPIVNRKGKIADAWQMAGQDELWRFRPDREPITPAIRKSVLDRDGRICQLCFGEIPDGDIIHLDHVVPVAHGDRSTEENLQVTHAACNLRKGARVPGGAA